jgi:hypothetical protein
VVIKIEASPECDDILAGPSASASVLHDAARNEGGFSFVVPEWVLTNPYAAEQRSDRDHSYQHQVTCGNP